MGNRAVAHRHWGETPLSPPPLSRLRLVTHNHRVWGP
jgi:hypothetical protein